MKTLQRVIGLRESILNGGINVAAIKIGNLTSLAIEKNAVKSNNFKTETFQAVLDSIYKEYGEYHAAFNSLKKVDPIYAVVLILGEMNYQVENGGFIPWYDNGYMSNGIASNFRGFFGSYTDIDIKYWLVRQLKTNKELTPITSTPAFKELTELLDGIDLENAPEEDDGSGSSRILTCEECDGEGTIEDEDASKVSTCEYCDGEGKYENEEYREFVLSLPYHDKTDEKYSKISHKIILSMNEFLKSYIYLKLKKMNSPLADKIKV